MYQLTFAAITPALVVGGFAERMKFSAILLLSSLWLVLVYAPICHWVWSDEGWLHRLGLIDFAGGTVVHITAGEIDQRSEEHTSELQSLMRISYAVFCLKKKQQNSLKKSFFLS